MRAVGGRGCPALCPSLRWHVTRGGGRNWRVSYRPGETMAPAESSQRGLVLIDHARAHFQREEELLEKYGYPELEQHKKEHRLITEQLEELHEAYQSTPDPDISQEIMELLTFWLVKHILEVDMRYKAYLQEAMA